MENNMDRRKRIKKIGALVVLGIFMATMLVPVPVAAYGDNDWEVDGENVWMGYNGAECTGNCGIGTDNPTSKLHVVGDVKIDSGDLNVDSGTLFVDNTNNRVGIGTTTPSKKLEIQDSTGAQLRLSHADAYYTDLQTTSEGYLYIDSIGGGVGIEVLRPFNTLDVEGNMAVGAGYSGSNTAPSNGMIVEGDVGIGVTSPANPLDIRGTSTEISEGGLSYGSVQLGVQGGTGRIQITDDGGTNWQMDAANGDLRFFRPGTVEMIIKNDGKVGIGTTSPSEKLDVLGSVHASGSFISGSTTTYGDGYITLSTGTNLNIDYNTLFIDNADDRVGIGTDSPEALLEVCENSGGAAIIGFMNTATGDCAVAMGRESDATGSYSIAMGYDTTASNDASTAMGWDTTASEDYSTAMGYMTTASGRSATATGYQTTASGDESTAMGNGITAAGAYSFGIGLDSNSHTITQNNVMAIMCGKVGIDTTHPDRKLEVVEDSQAQLRLTHTEGIKYVDFHVDTNHDMLIRTTSTGHIMLKPTTNTNDFFQVVPAGSGNPVLNVDTLNERVGIWTLNPNAKLEIYDPSGTQLRLTRGLMAGVYCDFLVDEYQDLLVKPSNTGHIKLQPTTDSTGFFQVLDADGGTPILNVDATNERVGIGTTSPDNLLDIEKQGTAESNLDIFHITNSVNAVDMIGTETSILFNQHYYDASTPDVADAGRITVGTETDWTSTASTQDGYMAFHTVEDGSVSEQVRITSDGNVGIGTTSPTGKLDINGNDIRIRSSLTPASASDSGNQGEICWDSLYIYVCVGTNTWKRAAISTW